MTPQLLRIASLAAPPLALAATRVKALRPLAATAVALHACALYGTLSQRSNLLGRAVRRFRTDAPEVWLTIDDGPHPQRTPELLATLARRQARATFFLIGAQAEDHPQLVREILAAGHSVGNHSYTHPQYSFWQASPALVAREIDRASEALAGVCGAAPAQFRAPVGHTPPLLREILAARGMRLIGWSASGRDGVDRNPRRVLARLARRLAPGAIVVIHDGGPLAPRILDGLLDELDARGLRTVLPAPDRLIF